MAKKMSKSAKQLYTLSCKAMGGKDCGFSVTTHSEDEAKKAIMAHARYAHPEKLGSMSEAEKQGMAKMVDGLLAKQR